jgi:hypothetical protein
MITYVCMECRQSIFSESYSHLSNCSHYPRPYTCDETCEDLYGMTDAEFKDMVMPDEGDFG